MEWPMNNDGIRPIRRAETHPVQLRARDNDDLHNRDRPRVFVMPPRRPSALKADVPLESPTYGQPRPGRWRPRNVEIVESDAEDGPAVRDFGRDRRPREARRSQASSRTVWDRYRAESTDSSGSSSRGYRRRRRSFSSSAYDVGSGSEIDEDQEDNVYDFALPEGVCSQGGEKCLAVSVTSPGLGVTSDAQLSFNNIRSATVVSVDRSQYTGDFSVDGEHGALLHDLSKGRKPLFRWM